MLRIRFRGPCPRSISLQLECTHFPLKFGTYQGAMMPVVLFSCLAQTAGLLLARGSFVILNSRINDVWNPLAMMHHMVDLIAS